MNGTRNEIVSKPISDSIAEEFSTSKAYAVGDMVMHEGTLYKFTAAHTAGAWNAGHVTMASVDSEIGELKDALDNLDIETDTTLSVSGKPADAKSVGDEITNLKEDLSEQIDISNNEVIFPQNTTFVSQINSAPRLLPFEDAIPNIRKYTGLIYYNGKLISSSGNTGYCFVSPYDNYHLIVRSSNVYSLQKIPVGTANEPVVATQLEGTSYGTNSTEYVIADRETIVFFNIQNVYYQGCLSVGKNHYALDGLELSDMQDMFARYMVSGDDTKQIPLDVVKVTDKLANTTSGQLATQSGYDTYYFQCPVSEMTVSCNNGFRVIITSKSPEEITTAGYLENVIYALPADRVETFNVELGQYVVIGIQNTNVLDLRTSLIKFFSLPTLRLDFGQKSSFYKLSKTSASKYLYIYYVSGDKVVQWELHNVPGSGSNSNTWQIGHVMGYDFNGMDVSNGVELVAGGEFELAWKEYGASDYCGGNNHGDENTIDFTLHIDGESIDWDNIDSDYHAFDRIDAIEHAYVNRCNTPNDNVLKHQKIWTFENGTVKVHQTLEFLQSVECDFLCCMLAANRSAFTHGVRQGRVGTEDMSTSSFDRVRTDENEMFYLLYGEHATAKVTARTCDHTPKASLWINNTSTLNKLYYNFYGQMPRTAVESGTVVWWEQEYDIAYN